MDSKINGQKMLNFFPISFLLFLFTSTIFSQELSLTIVPKPKEILKLNETFSISDPSISIKISVKDTSNTSILLDELKETFKLIKGFDISANQNAARTIWFGIPKDDEEFQNIVQENGIQLNDSTGEQGYSLIIKNDLMLIAANTKTGLYYGAQTIKQLLRGNRNNSSLPGIKIFDYPSLKYRGILDDISRGPVPTIYFMKEQIRRLAELKMNTLQYYIENVVETEKHGKFAPPDGSISIEEIKELSEYAKKYHIMLIGNFQSFGHFEKILSHPDYAHLGEGGTLLSPEFPESIELLKDIYSEMVPAFDSPFFNVNSDETFDLGKGASKPMVDSLGIALVYTNHIKKMYKILKDLNVRMMMWTDIVLKYPASLEMLPKDIIMMTWGYDDNESFANMIEPVKNSGYEFTISPGVLNSYSTIPNYLVTMPNIKNFARDGVHYGAVGMVLTVWDDGGSAFFSRDWYGIAYGADQSWNPSQEKVSQFDARFNPAVYGDNTNNLTKTIWQLVELAQISVTDGLKEKLLWTKVIPDSGESLRLSLEDWDMVIEIINSAEKTLNQAEPIRYKDDYDYFQFTIDQYSYFANLRFNLINAANFYHRAYEIQNEDKLLARKLLIKTIASIAESRNKITKLYNDYRNLWLKENKTHAVDVMLDKYQKQMDALKDIEERVFSALTEFDKRNNIPSAIEVRLSIEDSDGKYFREWMMINPVPNPEGSEGNSIDYLQEMGGELNAQPKVTQEFEYNGNIYRWRRAESELFDIVDLAKEFPNEKINMVTYAYANIDSPDDRIVTASLGSTDGVDVIINSELVFSVRKNRPLIIDENKFQLHLKEGRNHLMLKLFQGEGDWKFTFQLPDYKVSNSKNRYKIPESK